MSKIKSYFDDVFSYSLVYPNLGEKMHMGEYWGKCPFCEGTGKITCSDKSVVDCMSCDGMGEATDGFSYYKRFVE
jgi:hypothetical protein